VPSIDKFRWLDNPRFWVHFNGWLTVAWLTQFPLVLAWRRDLQKSVPYLIVISIAAAALGQLAAWQAARVELKLKHIDERRDEN
jgi:uncharacterized membrane protein